ncbi:hypothetical protein Poli38472_002580 [Pythium oligandrum]|uniref:Uncharacterized protein n=1 Tax=Pythium oligandrum TaxID=41045 RepID=A0A8K1CHF7_PYTOL|nr:hypothetical protein Poli38472_002580 [Pythium oligandrum]|eukprot:TMW63639.1 hypothetical protein Poli38472_002580 [Pythium oligandrum]
MLARAPVKTSNLFGSLNARPSTTPSNGSSGGASQSTEKKKRKKKKKTTGDAVKTDGDGREDAASVVSDADSKDSRSDSEEKTPLPLSRRLEIAASHSDLHAALVGLLGWSKLSPTSAAILTFFQSHALELLFENVLQSRPNAEVIFENLGALLTNGLATDQKSTKGSAEVAAVVVEAVRGMIETLESDSEDDVTSIKTVAKYLSKLVFQYRVSLTGVGAGSSLSQEILRIEAQLATAATRDGAVKGQSIRDSFQRRDIRSDALDLYESRLTKIAQLASETSSSETTPEQGAASGFLTFALQDADGTDIEIDPAEQQAIQSQLEKIEEQKSKALAPLQAQQTKHSTHLQTLHKRREELEEQLRAVNAEIASTETAQQTVEGQMEQVEIKFTEETLRFEENNKCILEQVERKQRRDQVATAFSKLEGSIAKIATTHQETQSPVEKLVVCLRQQLEGTLRYFGSQLPCVKFMMQRVDESQDKLTKLLGEAKGYEAIGANAVAKDVASQIESLQAHLLEDRQTIEALMKRDMEVLAMIKRIFADALLEEALAQLDANMKKEVLRHVDYVTKLYEPHQSAKANVDDGAAIDSSLTTSSDKGAIGSQKET